MPQLNYIVHLNRPEKPSGAGVPQAIKNAIKKSIILLNWQIIPLNK
ncbi:MAG: hypothetical protein K2X90_02455 [Candidatus Babeliaceae bacterium]|nr:hypothetical protein [Candidatus Babeliaceae bacterium]